MAKVISIDQGKKDLNVCTFLDENGNTHVFYGPDCAERAKAFQALLAAANKDR
jgi:hypothetical protein